MALSTENRWFAGAGLAAGLRSCDWWLVCGCQAP